MGFDGYGKLLWLDPQEFYAAGWSLFDIAVEGDDQCEYDIVISADKTELRYTVI